jgi:di/tricarboxylate transporter
MTDFLHHISPAAIGLGVALLMTIPKLGVLDAQDMKEVNFSLVLFVGGTLSMANVLTTTRALDLVAEVLLRWGEPFFSNGITASQTLYWGGFLYHFVAGGEHTMISSLLPVLLQISDVQHYNPITVGLIWNYSVSSYIFVYQSPVLVFAYSFGYFTSKDLLKVGILFAITQSILLLLLIYIYWPLIGLTWSTML